MDKAHILLEIRRIAEASGGIAPGWRKVATVTGIKYADWCGIHWARWNDALREAGLAPNRLTPAYEDAKLLDFYATLSAELGRLPTGPDIRLKTKRDSSFPNDRTFNRLGSKAKVVTKLLSHCKERPQFGRVVDLASDYLSKHRLPDDQIPKVPADESIEGFVYMERLGKHYKIGYTTAVPQRHRAISMELPEKPSVVHYIRTDDPKGIERYWHDRFAAYRTNGEWFTLTPREVRIFKRRKFM
jgi:hypothetical protein